MNGKICLATGSPNVVGKATMQELAHRQRSPIGADLLLVPIMESVLAPCWNCGGMIAKHPDKVDADSCWPPKKSNESGCCCVMEVKRSNYVTTIL